MTRFGHSRVSDVRLIVRRGLFAFKVDEVRLVNPLYLFELGLQATNAHLRTFLWVTALDVLLMAATQRTFVERINVMLGQDAFVFPAIPEFPQPVHTVGGLAKDLYELRSAVAHGQKIAEKFRKVTGLVSTDGAVIPGFEAYEYRNVLHDAALLLTMAALKKVLVGNYVNSIRNERTWRKLLSRGIVTQPAT